MFTDDAPEFELLDIMDNVPGDPISFLINRYIVRPGIKKGIATVRAQWRLQSQMPSVDRAWNKVRNELAEVGLLYEPDATNENDGGYLDQIRLEVALLPSFNDEMGYVFEELPWYVSLMGFEEGAIYLPSDLPSAAYVPGGTLTDVIRHEYGHTWHWLEPSFFDNDWFVDAFGDKYECDESTPVDCWVESRLCTRKHKKEMGRCRNEREIAALLQRRFREDFVSNYAATRFCEDFAETFMTYLRYRNSLDRFKARKGVYRKLKSVEKAVTKARLELGF